MNETLNINFYKRILFSPILSMPKPNITIYKEYINSSFDFKLALCLFLIRKNDKNLMNFNFSRKYNFI